MTTRQIKKYVAINPASSNEDGWITSDSIKEMSDIFRNSCVTTHSTMKKSKISGKYYCDSWEIYNTQINPQIIIEIQ